MRKSAIRGRLQFDVVCTQVRIVIHGSNSIHFETQTPWILQMQIASQPQLTLVAKMNYLKIASLLIKLSRSLSADCLCFNWWFLSFSLRAIDLDI